MNILTFVRLEYRDALLIAFRIILLRIIILNPRIRVIGQLFHERNLCKSVKSQHVKKMNVQTFWS